MARVIEWLKRKRSLAAAVAGVYVVLKVVRWVAGIGTSFGGLSFLEEATDFLSDHWLLAVAVLGALFLAVFVTVRWAIDWLDRRERRKRGSDSPAPS